MSRYAHRWKVEPIEGGIRICEGTHELSAPCEWAEYVSRSGGVVVSEKCQKCGCTSERSEGFTACEQCAAPLHKHAPAGDALAAAREAYRRQSLRVLNRTEGEYGAYTNADWQDVNMLWKAIAAARAEGAAEAEHELTRFELFAERVAAVDDWIAREAWAWVDKVARAPSSGTEAP